MLGMFSVKNEPSYLWIALVLLAAGAVFQEFAVVSYNAMLPQVSTPENHRPCVGVRLGDGLLRRHLLIADLLRRIHCA
jgi:MFS-type transporter involved in bile tolerance (Atg22 family)